MGFSDSTKKIIAREFLYFSSGLILVLLIFGGSFLYESYFESDKQRRDEYEATRGKLQEIQSEYGSNEYAERRRRLIWSNLMSRDLYSKSFMDFSEQFGSTEMQHKLFVQPELKSVVRIDSFNRFKRTYFPEIDSAAAAREDSLRARVSELFSYSFNMDVSIDNYRIAIISALGCFLIFFLVRHFYNGIVWAIKELF